PVPVWALALMLVVLGFCLGVGQPLSMTTVVQAAPDEARSTALALRLTGNRLGQVAAPAAAGLIAGVAGVAAPFVMLGALLLLSSGVALRSPSTGTTGTTGAGGANGTTGTAGASGATGRAAGPRSPEVGQDVPDRAGDSRPCREPKG
ncbi:MFS transporter, partial [Clavibacter michiganensis]